MAIRVSNKYETNHIKNKQYADRVITQKLSFEVLDLICSYLVSENRNILNKGYKNIREMINLMNLSDYKNDQEMERIDFIRFALDARLVHGIIKASEVRAYINQKDPTHVNNSSVNIKEMSNNDIDTVDNMVNTLLNTSTYNAYINRFVDLKKEFDSASIYDKNNVILKWSDTVYNCHSLLRSTKDNDKGHRTVSFGEGEYEDYVMDAYAYSRNESNKLHTGMVGMNYLLGGGFESGRVYGLFGLQGEGKSLTLLDLAYQIKNYNRKFKTKDPTKKPCVVYFTLENTDRESFSRLFTMATGERLNNPDLSAQDVMHLVQTSGITTTPDNPINIKIEYCPANSVTTEYLYDLADEMSDDGYEVICYIIDYINVIRSVESFRASDERLRLGSIITELKTIASDMDIPIITAGQLNREANRKVDEAREKGQYNLLSCIDRSNLGESMLILNNLDGAFVITPSSISHLKEKFLSIKLIKHRFEPFIKPLNYNYGIYHPYKNIDSIALVQDVNDKEPAFKLDLAYKSVESSSDVRDDVEIPDNSERGPSLMEGMERKSDTEIEKDPIVLYPDGTEPLYNTFWRTSPYPKTKTLIIGGMEREIPFIPSMSPEEILRVKKRKEMGNIMDDSINSLNGISRYSDEYTRLYDPTGSKEERLSHDYNIKYNAHFTERDFGMLYSHFMMMKNGEIKDDGVFVEPTKTYEIEKDEWTSNGLFMFVPEIDHQGYMKYIKSLSKKNKPLVTITGC